MALKKVFKSSFSELSYITKAGKRIRFSQNRYLTDDEAEVKELEGEIKSGNPYLYIDPSEKEIDTTLQDKIREAQKAAALSVLAEHNSAAPKQASEVAATPRAMSAAGLVGIASSSGLAALTGTSTSPK